MSLDNAAKVARAVLYEGYLLYPYTLSSTKNRQRWTFGGLYPPRFVEANPGADVSTLRAECLIEGGSDAQLSIRLRFLHLVARTGPEGEWEEAMEREVAVEGMHASALASGPRRLGFRFPHQPTPGQEPIQGELEIGARAIEEGGWKIVVAVRNTDGSAPSGRRAALLRSMVSTHLWLTASQGQFVSLIDPPSPFRAEADRCRNRGWWPVLLGSPGERSELLVAPIILYDHPQVAPESPGDLFDAGEIDEILSLRILTLSQGEKDAIRSADAVGRAMLERTERLTAEELLELHGTWRDERGRPRSVRVGDTVLEPGSRVRIRPRRKMDALDLILSGLTATVRSIEQDIGGEYQLCVSVDSDPGKDLDAKAQLGHRFFFRLEEVEPL